MDRQFKAFIKDSALFNHIESETLDEVVDLFQYQRLLRGDTLFKKGDSGDAFYILLSGRLQVIDDKPVAELSTGESFGELALINDSPRAATIKALRDSELGRLDKNHFEQILKNHAEVAVEIIKVMGGWLGSGPRFARKHSSSVVTVVELDEQRLSVQWLPSLTSELQKVGSAHYICEQTLDNQFCNDDDEVSAGSFREERFARWLSEQEEHYRTIILHCTARRSRWRDFCLRQADRVLYLADPLTPCERLKLKSPPDRVPEQVHELVLLHPRGAARPQNTRSWLSQISLSRHHHMRMGNNQDLHRMCRELNLCTKAVVLGGGGARSFAQIGVLKAMETLGIGIDRIGGTSMGAIIGAQYADGYTPDEILEINIDTWERNKPHKAFTLPISSLLTAGRSKRLIQNVFGERDIEDLWMNFFCISSDLTQLQSRCHETGKIWWSLLASGAIPGICSSIISDDGSLLVDGGLIDNLPVGVMNEMHEGTIIAVDVASDSGLSPNWQHTIPPNGLRALWHQVNPFSKAKPHPHIFKLFTHTLTLASKINSETSRQLADLCITLDCQDHGLMQMESLASLMTKGYDTAMPVLEAWQKDQEE
ncbi:MAG: patatin-like phospholipase family protein [Pseudomonadota bacterium]